MNCPHFEFWFSIFPYLSSNPLWILTFGEVISRPRSFGLLGLGTGCTSPRGQSFALQRTVSVAAALLVAWRVVACGWFGWAFGGVAGVVSFLSSHSFSSNSAALVSVQVRGPCAQSAACGLRIRYVAWSDRLEVQEPYGSASLWGSINWRQVEFRTHTHTLQDTYTRDCFSVTTLS